MLRAREIDTLVLFGIATGGVVLSTTLHAAGADCRLFIVKDCCADLDVTVHSCLIDKVFPLFATTLSSDEFLSILGARPNRRSPRRLIGDRIVVDRPGEPARLTSGCSFL